MLQRLKIKNFSSFHHEQEFVLDSPRATREDRRFFRVSDNENIALAAVIFGGNASGKTNFLRALPFLAGFIRNSWSGLKPGQPIPCLPFLFSRATGLSEFELSVISSQGNKYVYQLGMDTSKVHFENLKVKNIGTRAFSWLFKRAFNTIKLYPKSGFKLGDLPRKSLRENSSLISASLQSGITVFDDFISSIQITTNTGTIDVFDIGSDNLYLDKLYSNQILKNLVTEMMRKCDTAIFDLDIVQEDLSDQDKINLYNAFRNQPFFNIDESTFKEDIKSYRVGTIHRLGDSQYQLPLDLESDGIKKLIPLITMIFTTLHSGGIMVFDEIEKGLHPQLVKFILDLFYDSEINTKHAQLICTTHSADCLNFLSKYQVFLTDKDQEQATSITRLSDIGGVRNDDNLMQKYLAGAYGGVPLID